MGGSRREMPIEKVPILKHSHDIFIIPPNLPPSAAKFDMTSNMHKKVGHLKIPKCSDPHLHSMQLGAQDIKGNSERHLWMPPSPYVITAANAIKF